MNFKNKMQIKFKQTWAFIFLVVLTVTYLAINFFEYQSSEDKVKNVYFADRITPAHKILIDEYNKIHKGKIKVIPIDFPNNDFSTNERKEIVARSLRSRGDGIDLFAVDIIWVQRFAKWAEPLNKYFSPSEMNEFFAPSLSTCYYNKELVAVPLDIAMGVMYYREDILKKLKDSNKIISEIQHGITWDEFIKLKSQNGLPNTFFIFPGADYEGLVCFFIEQLLSIEPDYFQKEGFNFQTPQAHRALQLLVDLVNKYKISPRGVTQYTETISYEKFMKGNGIFLRGWQTYNKDFEDSHSYPFFNSHLKMAPLPHFSSDAPAAILGGWDLMISKFSDKKPEAIDFVKFLLREESQKTFFLKAGFYPVLKKFYSDSTYQKEYPDLEKGKELLATEVSRPGNPEYTKFSKIMSFYFNEAIEDKISVQTALEKATNAIKVDKIILQ